jgi:hypothetical protein
MNGPESAHSRRIITLFACIQFAIGSITAQEPSEHSLKGLLLKQGFSGQLEGNIQFKKLGWMDCNARKLQSIYYRWEESNPPGLAIHINQRVVFMDQDGKYLGSYVVDDIPTKTAADTLSFKYLPKLGNVIRCNRDGLPASILLNGESRTLAK